MTPDDDQELAAIRARLMADMMSRSGEPAPAPRGPEWPDAPVVVTDADFQDTVKKYPLALVDFWAPWCGPCRTIAPSIEALAQEMRGSVAFLKLNTDENPKTASKYGIQSLPTLGIFRDGLLIDGIIGAQPKPAIAAALRRHQQRRGTPGPRRL